MSWLDEETGVTEPPMLLAMLPCPLKVPVEEDFWSRAEAGEWGQTERDLYLFEGNANQTDFYKRVGAFQREEELPDLIISPGISSFFHREFRSRFIDENVFTDVTKGQTHSRFEEMGLADPTGRYTMLCVNPLVMVVDHTRLGDLPVPRSWAELLKPEYRRKVSVRGQKDTFCETSLLTLRHIYGMEAVEAFGEAAEQGQHPAQMAKMAGTGNPAASAILVMPYFYAQNIVKKDKVEIVWPEEGAIASPVFLLAKASKAKELAPLIDYLSGEHTANMYEKASFPALHPAVESKLPEGAGLLWMGWDMIWNEDIEQVTQSVHNRFLKGYRKGREQ